MGKRNRNKSSPNVCEPASVKRQTMAANVFGSPTGVGLSPTNQGQSFSMPPTYSYVPQYTTLGPVPAPVGQQTHNVIQQNSDVMVQILQRLDIMDKKLGQLENIQASVNTITTRMNSVDQKVTSLESKITDIEKSRDFDSNSLDAIRKKQTDMETMLSQLQKKQNERSEADTRVQSSLTEMKCLEMKNNLLFFKISEELDQADREIEQCVPKIQRIMEENMGIENARHSIGIKRALRLGRYDAAKTRPILVEFQTFNDRETVRKSSPKLKDTDYGVSQQFPRDVVLKRRKLLPILKNARSEKKRAYLSFDKLYIDGELYSGPEA